MPRGLACYLRGVDLETFKSLAAALGLGLFVGLQRERSKSEIAGFRTFALITTFGAVCGLLTVQLGSWPIVAGFLAVTATTIMGNELAARRLPGRSSGITTEIAALLMFGVGALCVLGPLAVAVAVGVLVAILLEFRTPMHGLAAKVGERDMRAIMMFAAITFIVLPVLPDRTYGPLHVLNPRNIWLMVVLVAGISLGGYIAYKMFGGRTGTVLAGILGGAISSTATTVTYSRRASSDARQERAAALVILLASAVVYVRLLIEIGVVAPRFLPRAAVPLGIMLGAALAMALILWFRSARDIEGLPPQGNPTQIKSALVFAGLYALVLLGVAAAKKYFGQSGIYAVAAISGLTDNDAITLSTSQLVEQGTLAPETGWRAIVIAVIANVLFKAGIVAVLGGRRLFMLVGLLMGIQVAVGLLLLVLLA